ncbi:C6 zinc finger domain protein [Penicillium longicatenatum]|nr:C6 zinc finger domain protein [Penicillium longicatenatum]
MVTVTRRSHRKSRNGCIKCKERHIKCDEGLPKCSSCAARGLHCQYVTIRAEGGQRNEPSAGLSSETTSPAPSDSDGNGIFLNKRLVETKLLHHYYTSTCFSMGKNKHSLATWQVSLPQLATSNEHVLDSILAFTALHLAYLEAWVRLALEYSKEAYSGFAKIISRLSPSTAPSAFVCSVLIALSAMAQHGALGITTGPTYLPETLRLKNLSRVVLYSTMLSIILELKAKSSIAPPRIKRTNSQYRDAVLTIKRYDQK